jgi:hypothetical protein
MPTSVLSHRQRLGRAWSANGQPSRLGRHFVPEGSVAHPTAHAGDGVRKCPCPDAVILSTSIANRRDSMTPKSVASIVDHRTEGAFITFLHDADASFVDPLFEARLAESLRAEPRLIDSWTTYSGDSGGPPVPTWREPRRVVRRRASECACSPGRGCGSQRLHPPAGRMAREARGHR